jgi:hypothetical protein
MEKKDNFLEYVPIQNCPWKTDDKGNVYLIKEKTRNKLLKKIISILGRSQDFHIHFDGLGSAAWLKADGSRTILAIGAAMKEGHDVGAEALELRLAKFFAMLARDGFVRWLPHDSVAGSGG